MPSISVLLLALPDPRHPLQGSGRGTLVSVSDGSPDSLVWL